ncbi:MAG: GumC family protein [Candidatus Hydrogenedentota bacterium]
MQSDSGIFLNSVRDIFYVIFRHKWWILTFFVLVTILVTAVTFVLPTAYRSEADLLVRIGYESMPADVSVDNTLVNVNQERTGEVKAEVSILTSYELAEGVVDKLGEGWILDRPELRREDIGVEPSGPPNIFQQISRAASSAAKEALIFLRLKERLTPHEEAIKTLQDNLEVEVEDRTNNINVALMLEQPQVTQQVLEQLIDDYLERHIDVFALNVSPTFYKTEADKREEQLREKENDLRAFRERHNISSIPAQTETLLAQMSDLEGQLSTVRGEERGLDAMVTQLGRAIEGQTAFQETSRTSGLENRAADTMKERLLDLRTEEKDLAARYADTYRPLVELREQIAVVEALLAAEDEDRTEVTTMRNENLESFEHTMESERANLEAARARIEKLETELERLEARHIRFGAVEVEYDRLQRERDRLEEEYQELRDAWLEASINQEKQKAKYSNVSVVQAASLPLAPEKPRKLRNVSLGLLLGLFGGIVFAFVREYLDDTLNTVEATEKRLGVPVLAEVSQKEFKSCT